MAELYTITIAGTGMGFTKREGEIPDFARSSTFDLASAPKGLALVCRMGATDLLHCMIFRYAGKDGGVFVLHEQGELLFAAVAESNLAYALAKGYFGELVANTRFGVDIFEAAEEEND